ncbi:hypothetical protein SPBR_00357 [Sporothrix brasiliensis 5110]|uniref:Uncharacterized protein n=1 Tax=Sporothrix brasiliensis 5110 TaxID=1398154 RepID=A0A0C2EVV0_9PEZI|nr:uncharacterized protein SPBR_00357 [Sporothrix brasiliensis 5110]KIH90674.1 hypothetical protein SPBR_00357 [Sporothrix brasiliensis 5110]
MDSFFDFDAYYDTSSTEALPEVPMESAILETPQNPSSTIDQGWPQSSSPIAEYAWDNLGLFSDPMESAGFEEPMVLESLMESTNPEPLSDLSGFMDLGPAVDLTDPALLTDSAPTMDFPQTMDPEELELFLGNELDTSQWQHVDLEYRGIRQDSMLPSFSTALIDQEQPAYATLPPPLMSPELPAARIDPRLLTQPSSSVMQTEVSGLNCMGSDFHDANALTSMGGIALDPSTVERKILDYTCRLNAVHYYRNGDLWDFPDLLSNPYGFETEFVACGLRLRNLMWYKYEPNVAPPERTTELPSIAGGLTVMQYSRLYTESRTVSKYENDRAVGWSVPITTSQSTLVNTSQSTLVNTSQSTLGSTIGNHTDAVDVSGPATSPAKSYLQTAVDYWNLDADKWTDDTWSSVSIPSEFLPTAGDNNLGLQKTFVQCPLAAEAIVDLAIGGKINFATQRPMDDVVSGSVFIFKDGEHIKRWTDNHVWTVSRKGAGAGDMVYREAIKGQASREIKHIEVTDANAAEFLHISADDIAKCRTPVEEIASLLVCGLTSADNLKHGGLVKRTTKVVRLVGGGRVARESKPVKDQRTDPRVFSVYRVVSYYTISDVCNRAVVPFRV